MKKIFILILFCIPFIAAAQTEGNQNEQSSGSPGTVFPEASDIDASAENSVKAEGLVTDPKEQKIFDAFTGMRDQYEIPLDLYSIDRMLMLKRNMYESSRSTETTLGIVSLIFIPLGILSGIALPELAWAPYGIETRIPWGYAIAVIGGGIGLYDLIGVMPKTRKYRIEFDDYFNNTYENY